MTDKRLVNQYHVRLPEKFKVNVIRFLTTLPAFQFIKLEWSSAEEYCDAKVHVFLTKVSLYTVYRSLVIQQPLNEDKSKCTQNLNIH